MKKRIVAIIAGLLCGWLIIAVGETITHSIYPAPDGLDYTNPEALNDFIQTLPVSAFISLLIIWALSAVLAGFVCCKINTDNWQRSTLICGAILLIGHLINAFTIPQPGWLSVLSIVMIIPLVYSGGKIAQP